DLVKEPERSPGSVFQNNVSVNHTFDDNYRTFYTKSIVKVRFGDVISYGFFLCFLRIRARTVKTGIITRNPARAPLVSLVVR
ncbi:MAG: hypothetical protein ACXAEI_12530, partial [Candidatus Hodarchaeales archaeon]